MVAEGFSSSKEFPVIVGISVEYRVPPTPPVTSPEVAVRAKPVTWSLGGGGGAVDDVDVVVEVVLVVEVVIDVEVEPEGGSDSPISPQG